MPSADRPSPAAQLAYNKSNGTRRPLIGVTCFLRPISSKKRMLFVITPKVTKSLFRGTLRNATMATHASRIQLSLVSSTTHRTLSTCPNFISTTANQQISTLPFAHFHIFQFSHLLICSFSHFHIPPISTLAHQLISTSKRNPKQRKSKFHGLTQPRHTHFPCSTTHSFSHLLIC